MEEVDFRGVIARELLEICADCEGVFGIAAKVMDFGNEVGRFDAILGVSGTALKLDCKVQGFSTFSEGTDE